MKVLASRTSLLGRVGGIDRGVSPRVLSFLSGITCGVFGAFVFHMPVCAQAVPQSVRWHASNRPAAPGAGKKDVLARLKTLQDKQIADATDLENAIRKQLSDTITMTTGDNQDVDFAVTSRQTALVTKKIEELNRRRSELNARREIVDRVIFQIDSKWDNHTKLQDFLVQVFLEMAATDLADNRDNRLWKEFTYLSMVMRESTEPNQDAVALFEGYLNYASVLDPKTPADFLASRNYTNGVDSATAHASSRESLGDGLRSEIKSSPTSVPALVLSAKDMGLKPAPVQISAAKSPETAARAQADSGQVPMPSLPAGNSAATADATAKATSSGVTSGASDFTAPSRPIGSPNQISPTQGSPTQGSPTHLN